ncbi:MAG: hypothetical protein IPM54_23420 [Polyangiaceae bacterium]|nr:hypothetical protein [Polyangiaceae bacterium]
MGTASTGATAYPPTVGLILTDALHPAAAVNEMASSIQNIAERLVRDVAIPSGVLSLLLIRTGHLSCVSDSNRGAMVKRTCTTI